MASQTIWEDKYGEVIDRPEQDLLEIRWFDATSDFTGEGFNRWLVGFANGVDETGRSRILVDSIVFNMDMASMDMAWRDANIIPRYNAAGIKKFAFLMPAGMPAIGSEAVEGPATFPTAYFGKREDAIAWLTS